MRKSESVPDNQNAVAVTKNGPYFFPSVDDALAHPDVSLADPIFTRDRPIDTTLIRGLGLEGFQTHSGTPWDYLTSRAIPAPIPTAPAKRKKGSTCGE